MNPRTLARQAAEAEVEAARDLVDAVRRRVTQRLDGASALAVAEWKLHCARERLAALDHAAANPQRVADRLLPQETLTLRDRPPADQREHVDGLAMLDAVIRSPEDPR